MSFAPKHILVPVAVDDTMAELTKEAIIAACDLAEKFAARITLLHLTPLVTPGDGIYMDVSGEAYQSLLEVLRVRLSLTRLKLNELQEEAKQRGIAIEGRMVDSLEGTADMILHTVDEIRADLLVMSSQGRQGFAKMFFGSVAEKVAENSAIPVLLLHPSRKKKTKK